jgi:hypothetical protein
MTAWSRWVAFWDRREGGETLAMIRVCVALVVLWDFGTVARHGLVRALWAPIDTGGIGPSTRAAPISVVYEWIGASATGAWLLFGTCCLCALALCVGLFTRVSALALCLGWAQLAQLSPDADRGIDTLLRNALLVLGCSSAGATASLDARLWHGRWFRDIRVPAWPRYVLVLQLVVLYFWAGMVKQSPPWTSIDGYSALYITLSQPHYATFGLSPRLLAAVYPLLQVATFLTVWFERLAPAVPVLLWLRATADRPGGVRKLINRLHLLEVWVMLGVVFHLGLAASVELGMFPWGCLALYPALCAPETLRRWVQAARARFARTQPTRAVAA